jgi:hypothetical protein
MSHGHAEGEAGEHQRRGWQFFHVYSLINRQIELARTRCSASWTRVLRTLYSRFDGWAKFVPRRDQATHAYEYLSGENLRKAAAVLSAAASAQLAKKRPKEPLIPESVTFFCQPRCTFPPLAYNAGLI